MSPDYNFYVPPDQEDEFNSLIAEALSLPGVVFKSKKRTNGDEFEVISNYLTAYLERCLLVIDLGQYSPPEKAANLNSRYTLLLSNAAKAAQKYQPGFVETIDFSDPAFLYRAKGVLFDLFLRPTTLDLETIKDEGTFKHMRWKRYGIQLLPVNVETLIDRFGLNGKPLMTDADIASQEKLTVKAINYRSENALWRLGTVPEMKILFEEFRR